MRAARRTVLAIATLAGGSALAGGCHRSAMPPRPDGAAVVVAPETVDDGIATAPEVEPNDTLAKAQRAAGHAGDAGRHRRDPRRGPASATSISTGSTSRRPMPGASPAPAGDAAVAAPPPRLLLRADVRPAAGSAWP